MIKYKLKGMVFTPKFKNSDFFYCLNGFLSNFVQNLRKPANMVVKTQIHCLISFILGHAYVCTKVCSIEVDGKDYNLIRLYNPWGSSISTLEWNGEWYKQLKIFLQNSQGDTAEQDIFHP